MSKADDRGRTMPNRKENDFMLDLMMLRNTLWKNGDAAKERLKGCRWARRDMGMLWHLVNKLQRQMMDTMPDRRVQYYERLASCGKVIIDIPGPIPKGRHLLVSVESMGAIAEAAMRSECAMCIRTGKEVLRCPIRGALLETAPPTRVNQGEKWFRCEYRDAAGALVKDEDITI